MLSDSGSHQLSSVDEVVYSSNSPLSHLMKESSHRSDANKPRKTNAGGHYNVLSSRDTLEQLIDRSNQQLKKNLLLQNDNSPEVDRHNLYDRNRDFTSYRELGRLQLGTRYIYLIDVCVLVGTNTPLKKTSPKEEFLVVPTSPQNVARAASRQKSATKEVTSGFQVSSNTRINSNFCWSTNAC